MRFRSIAFLDVLAWRKAKACVGVHSAPEYTPAVGEAGAVELASRMGRGYREGRRSIGAGETLLSGEGDHHGSYQQYDEIWSRDDCAAEQSSSSRRKNTVVEHDDDGEPHGLSAALAAFEKNSEKADAEKHKLTRRSGVDWLGRPGRVIDQRSDATPSQSPTPHAACAKSPNFGTLSERSDASERSAAPVIFFGSEKGGTPSSINNTPLALTESSRAGLPAFSGEEEPNATMATIEEKGESRMQSRDVSRHVSQAQVFLPADSRNSFADGGFAERVADRLTSVQERSGGFAERERSGGFADPLVPPQAPSKDRLTPWKELAVEQDRTYGGTRTQERPGEDVRGDEDGVVHSQEAGAGRTGAALAELSPSLDSSSSLLAGEEDAAQSDSSGTICWEGEVGGSSSSVLVLPGKTNRVKLSESSAGGWTTPRATIFTVSGAVEAGSHGVVGSLAWGELEASPVGRGTGDVVQGTPVRAGMIARATALTGGAGGGSYRRLALDSIYEQGVGGTVSQSSQERLLAKFESRSSNPRRLALSFRTTEGATEELLPSYNRGVDYSQYCGGRDTRRETVRGSVCGFGADATPSARRRGAAAVDRTTASPEAPAHPYIPVAPRPAKLTNLNPN